MVLGSERRPTLPGSGRGDRHRGECTRRLPRSSWYPRSGENARGASARSAVGFKSSKDAAELLASVVRPSRRIVRRTLLSCTLGSFPPPTTTSSKSTGGRRGFRKRPLPQSSPLVSDLRTAYPHVPVRIDALHAQAAYALVAEVKDRTWSCSWRSRPSPHCPRTSGECRVRSFVTQDVPSRCSFPPSPPGCSDRTVRARCCRTLTRGPRAPGGARSLRHAPRGTTTTRPLTAPDRAARRPALGLVQSWLLPHAAGPCRVARSF